MAMAMAMDEELFEHDCWALQLQRGKGITLIPWEDEPFVITDVFFVDPESAADQGVVSISVEMGTRRIALAELSSEVTDVELETPVVLDEEFRLYVERSDADAADTDEDALVVQFEGYIDVPYADTDEESEEEDAEDEGFIHVPCADTDEESEEEDEEDDEAASSEDDQESIDEDYEKAEKSDAEVDGDVATNPGGNAKDV